MYNVRVNAPIANPETAFVYTPPPGVKKYVRKASPPLLAIGSSAPDFSALDKNNRPIKLSSYKGKVVIVDFWASWCGPCVASMPHTQEVVDKLQKEGVPVVLLAVDDAEERAAFLKWVAKHESEYNALVFLHADPQASQATNISRNYQVSAIPTQYIIDASGVIRSSSIGYDGPTDRLEKAVREAVTVPLTIAPYYSKLVCHK
ncbi:MAG: TlpA family protein disulfide reductase [Proteobacteria bacterium]|nr:MAG: TlpA family protein disulfide reductase [Pseudomonadota bacterium]